MAQETIFWVELTGDLTHERFTELLAQEQLAQEAEANIYVEGRSVLAYRVPYRFVTLLQRYEQHKKNFRLYEQQGGGKIRKSRLHTLNQGRHQRSAAYKDMEELTKRITKK